MTTDQHITSRPRADGNEGDQPSSLAAPSALYPLRFELPDGMSVLKLGVARDPQARLEGLLHEAQIPTTLLRVVPVASGAQALRIEKRLQARLRRDFPDAVVPKARFAAYLQVSSEVYVEALGPHLHACLDAVAVAVRETIAAAEATTHGAKHSSKPAVARTTR